MSSKSLREQSQEFRDTQRRAKTYRIGRPLGPTDKNVHAVDGPHLHVPGDMDDDMALLSAAELAEEGALYAITAPQEPRGHGTARHVMKRLPEVPKAMLELAAARRLEASLRMHLANRVMVKVFHVRALRFRAALRIQTWVLAVKSRRVARVIREAFLLERHIQKSAIKIQARIARGPAARRRTALLRRWRKLGLSHADMWREQLRDRRALYVSKGHRERFRVLASVLQAAARRRVLMNKYMRYQLKRSQMSDEELLFENLRLNKVLDHAFWRDFGPSDWKKKGPLLNDRQTKRGPGQWWLHYGTSPGDSRPATRETSKTGNAFEECSISELELETTSGTDRVTFFFFRKDWLRNQLLHPRTPPPAIRRALRAPPSPTRASATPTPRTAVSSNSRGGGRGRGRVPCTTAARTARIAAPQPVYTTQPCPSPRVACTRGVTEPRVQVRVPAGRAHEHAQG